VIHATGGGVPAAAVRAARASGSAAGSASEIDARRRPPALAAAAFVALACALAYRGAVELGFVWDDHVLVAANPALSGLSGLGEALGSDLYLGKASGSASSGYWRPVAVLSYAVNAAAGAGPAWLHAGNVLLHAVAGALLALLLARRLGRGAWAAAGAAALLWALHPEHAEVVAWISCRYDLLATLALLALLLVPWRPGPGRAALHGAVFLAGLLSKEGFLAVAAVVLADDWASRRAWRDAVPRWLAVAAAVAVWLGVRALLGIHSVVPDAPRALLELPGAYLTALGTYAARAVAPLPLSIGHPYTALGPLGAAAAAALLGGLVLLALRVRRLAVPVAALLAPLCPVALASAGMGVAAERYFYLPSIGLAWLLAEALAAARARARGVLARRVVAAAPALVAAVALPAGAAVAARLPDWRTDETLFTSALRLDPGEWQSNLNLGIAVASVGRLDDALALVGRARERNPRSGEVASALAWVHLLRGDARAALEQAEDAVRLDPAAPQAHLHLAAALHVAGDHGRERDALDAGLRLAPGYGPLQVVHAAARCDTDPSPGCEAELVRLAGQGGGPGVEATAELCAVHLRRRDLAGAARWLDVLRAASPEHPRLPELQRAVAGGR
jgi:protein O-mannosyl-transferase